MKPGLKPGASHVNRIKIDRDRTIDFMGEEGRVYGTPFLVRDIEQTCRQLLLEYAEPGEDFYLPAHRKRRRIFVCAKDYREARAAGLSAARQRDRL